MYMKYLVNILYSFSIGSHFTQNVKMALLSLSLNLEAQYHTTVMDLILEISTTKGIVDLVYVE